MAVAGMVVICHEGAERLRKGRVMLSTRRHVDSKLEIRNPQILQKEFQTSRVINTGLFAVVPCVDQRAMNKSWFVLLPFHPKMGLNMTARRLLVLVCLFLAAASLQLASGQETLQEGLQEGGVDVDEVADATGLSEVRV